MISTQNYCCRGLQIGGVSDSKSNTDLPFWDLFRIDKITNFEVLPHLFNESNGLEKGYKKDDKHINPILAQI